MSIEYVFAGLAVTRLDAGIDWYQRLLGKPPDMRPNEREATWRVAQTASVYIVADAGRAGHSAVTMFVDDLRRRARRDHAPRYRGGRRGNRARLVPQGDDPRPGRQ